jgi:hypothetical protein
MGVFLARRPIDDRSRHIFDHSVAKKVTGGAAQQKAERGVFVIVERNPRTWRLREVCDPKVTDGALPDCLVRIDPCWKHTEMDVSRAQK